MAEGTHPMVTDIEGARLLSWLASSQAVDDINSDDELGQEVILSPLFPTKSYEKVLEKAHLDYESASQKECQDILDTVEESKSQASKDETASFPENRYSDIVIPQVDGLYDDQDETSLGKACDGNTNCEAESSALCQEGKSTYKKLGKQNKRNKSVWGSLPFSTKQNELEGSISSSVNSEETGVNEARHDTDSSLLLGNRVDGNHDKNNLYIEVSSLEVAEDPGRNSLRDLMRKKRCVHTDIAEYERDMTEEVGQIQDAEMSPSRGRVAHNIQIGDSHGTMRGICLGRQPSTSYIAMACSMTEKIGMLNCDLDIKKSTDTGLNHNLLAGSCSDNPPEFSGMQGSNNNGNNGQNIEVVTTGLHDVDLINKQGNVELLTDELMKTSSVDFDFHGTSNMDIKRTENPQESFEMVLCWKPPTLEQIIKDSEDVSYVGCHIVEGVHNSKRSLRDSFLSNDNERQDDQCVPPFFLKNTKVERGLSHKPFNNEEAPYFHQEVMGGIPVHFQNDGSLLYLLTYAASPPSFDSVSHWVSEQKHQGFEYFLTKKCLENVIKADGGIPCVDKSGHTPNSHVPVLENIGNASHQFEDTCDLKAMLDYLNEEKNTRTMERNSVYDADNMTTETQTTFFDSEGMEPISNWHGTSQISGPDRRSKLTPLSQIGFRDPASMGGGQQLTLLSIEVQAETRGDLRPDPQFDAVNVVTLVIQEDSNDKTDVYVLLRSSSMEQSGRNVDGISDSKFVISSDEKNLFQSLTKIICSIDPDILMGWETQGGSLGFLTERASQIGIHFLKNISRTPVFDEVKISVKIKEEVIGNSALKNPTSDKVIYENSFIEDEWGRTHGSGFHVGGRIVLNLWRLMRAEVKLNMYTVEAVAEEALRQKIPFIPCKVLNNWFFGGCHRALFRCIEYNIGRAKLNLTIVNQLDLINRTSELARVFGIDFFSVLSRGSQFRVESMLLRLAHTQNYLAISPGNQQVSSQPAMECLPLIMEPLSGFYADPVIVLDFQSLYPSMIIAYNLCFSTCLGKVVPSKENVLGVTSYSPDRRLFRDISEQILLCPNGVMYVPSKVRQGVLPRLLEEILSTRIMVKQKMKKLEPSKRVLQRVYNARQLALKLIANVTYGYTAAGFSGRMPCAELADSIVQCGRRTLETAISYVNSHSSWKASVVYGDTDSMFVHLKGRSLEEAFKIGNEIASAITAMNPNPVTLKLEKIYHPCFLLTKKRYVGYSYESPDQDTPMFDAKGIETVRRDTCPAVAKILEQSLRIYFEHQDISEVKLYLQRQWTRILRGKFSIQDFIFAKEVRLGTYSANASSLPPAAIVATKKMRDDPRSEPHYAERVPYVVIHGEPGARLVDMVVDPFDLLDIASPYRLNNLYYINKQIIPALQRVFWLIGVDLKQWYSEIHRPARPTLAKCYLYVSNSGSTHDPDSNMQRVSKKHVKRSRIDSYYLSKNCSICGGLVQSSAFVCTECSKKGSIVAATIIGKTSKLEREIQHLSAICSHCGGADWIIESGVKCNSLVCSVFYERRKVQKELQALSAVATEAGFYPRCMAELF